MKLFGRWKGRTLSGFERKKISKNILPYSVLLAAIFAMTFFGVCIPQSGPSGPRRPAAYVEDQVITYREFRRSYENVANRLRSTQGSDYDPALAKIAATTMSGLVYQRVGYSMALDLGIVASDQSVYDFIAQIDYFKSSDDKFDRKKFRDFLDFQGYTEASFFEEIKRELTFNKLEGFINSGVYHSESSQALKQSLSSAQLKISYLKIDPEKFNFTVSDDDVSEFLSDENNLQLARQQYQMEINQYVSSEKYLARQLLISYKGARNALSSTRSKAQALDLVTEIHSVLSQNLNDLDKIELLFKQYLDKYVDDPKLKNDQGNLGVITKQDLPANLSEQAFKLEQGQITDIVETDFGFHILQIIEFTPPKNITFDEVKNQLAKKLLSVKKNSSQAFSFAQQVLGSISNFNPNSTEDSFNVNPLQSEDSISDASQLQTEVNTPPSFEQLSQQYPLIWLQTEYFPIKISEIPGVGNSPEALFAILMILHQDGFVTNLNKSSDNPQQDNSLLVETLFPIEGKFFIIKVDDLKIDKPSDQDSLQSFDEYTSAERINYFDQLINYQKQMLEEQGEIKTNQDYLILDNPSAN